MKPTAYDAVFGAKWSTDGTQASRLFTSNGLQSSQQPIKGCFVHNGLWMGQIEWSALWLKRYDTMFGT